MRMNLGQKIQKATEDNPEECSNARHKFAHTPLKCAPGKLRGRSTKKRGAARKIRHQQARYGDINQ
jgi:hypothetical protein